MLAARAGRDHGIAHVTFGSDLYDAMAPLARTDATEQGGALALFCEAIGVPFEWVETYALDTDQAVGWSLLMSPWTCPAEGLAWLGQFVGVVVNPTATESAQRQQIATHSGFQRGTPASIIAAAQLTLTGNQTVYLTERVGGNPWQLGAVTYTSETPDPAATLKAIQSSTPAGIVVTYSAQTWSYATVKAARATYTAVKAAYPDYTSLLAGGA